MYIIHYPGCATENCPATCSAKADIILELRPSVFPVLNTWFIRFSNRWAKHERLELNKNSRIVTPEGEIYEFLDFPKLAMKLERTELEKTLEAL